MKNPLLVILTLAACLVTASLPSAAMTQDDDPNVLGVVVVTE